MKVNHYWRERWWNKYGIKVKRIHITYNPLNFWGTIPHKMYILYTFNNYGFKELAVNRIFTCVEEIEDYLEYVENEDLDKNNRE